MPISLACPDPEVLQAYWNGRLAEANSWQLYTHLAECPECSALLCELGRANDLCASLGAGEHPLAQEQTPPPLADLVANLKEMVQQSQEMMTPPTRELASMPSGGMVGRYRLLEVIGVGGMGTIFKALDPDLGRPVAVKVPRFLGTAAQQARVRQRFFREARAAARIQHENVCPIHDVGEHEGRPYVVMTFVEGESLWDRLRERGRFEDCRQAAGIVKSVAEALEAIHRSGILHRDLKPANILLDRLGQPLIIDFGLARVPEETTPLTLEGAVLGTPAYMAPEQVGRRGGTASAATDVYALGAVFYQLLTGRPPFEGSTHEVLRQLAESLPPPPSYYRPDLDKALEVIVLKAIAPTPDRRYASAAGLAADLGRWLQGSQRRAGMQTTSPPVAPEPLPRTGWPRWLVRLSVAALLLLVPTIALGTLTTKPTVPPQKLVAEKRPPFKGSIDVLLWESDRAGMDRAFWRRDGFSLRTEGALPLREGDRIRVEAELNQPGYLYVFWINVDGTAQPVYPWEKGDWKQRPAVETATDVLSLPEVREDGKLSGWKIGKGKSGMVTLLMLVSERPLLRNVDMQKILSGLPGQSHQNLRSVAWFENCKLVTDKADVTRGPILFDPEVLSDPVMETQHWVRTRLQPYGVYTRAVSFATLGF